MTTVAPEGKVLWTAPAPNPLWHEVQRSLAKFDLVKQETWLPEDLRRNADVHTWVCNPSASFTITAQLLLLYPNLKVLVTPSTGTTHIHKGDVAEAGVALRTLLDDREGLEEISASAEFTFLLLLAAMRNMQHGVDLVGDGYWHEEQHVRGNELQGKTVGLIGYGRIGRRMAGWLTAFGATSLPYDPYVLKGTLSLREVFAYSDAVVICCALTDETEGMIKGEHLRLMRKRAVLVNTARGEIFDEQSVLDALEERADLRVAVDVLPGEARNAMRTKEWYDTGAIITPHMAGTTIESQTKAAKIACKLIKRYWKQEGE